MSEHSIPGVHEALIKSRDRKLIESFQRILLDKTRRRSVIGIVFGASHMRAITDTLMVKLRYQVAHADWLSVFDYEDS